ncbi:hypothetical protein BC830DRAFT_1174031 [Chytriomyces sp. MP71]|nr:hypothetical protein BC830DRAFT_1174031 [Chytriomyces sp. MP71]
MVKSRTRIIPLHVKTRYLPQLVCLTIFVVTIYRIPDWPVVQLSPLSATDAIPLQTQWRHGSLTRAPQVLDIIQQEHADRIDWPFLRAAPYSASAQPVEYVRGYFRYGAKERVSMPHAAVDPRFTKPRSALKVLKGKRIAFLNGHAGTRDDFAFAAHQLGVTYAELDPRAFWYYGINETHANYVNQQGLLGDFFCKLSALCFDACFDKLFLNITPLSGAPLPYNRSFDIVVVGDTITDVRFLLQWIDKPTQASACGIDKIIMMTTNRFDFAVKEWDLPAYYALLRRASARTDSPRLVWTANNPFDIKYAQVLLEDSAIQFTLIRSFGYSTVPIAQPFPSELTRLPVMFNHYDESRYIAWLKRNGIEVAVFGRNYGGPTSVSQFRVFIDFPYQASTMKMYENLLYGVVTFAPSKRLYVEELQGYIIEGDRVPGQWQDYVEYWYADLADYVYTFDSIAELKRMLALEEVDPNHVRERGVDVWRRWNEKSVEAWRDVLTR